MQKIAFFRKRNGYSQAKLAAELGCSGAVISEIEIRKRSPTFAQAKKLLELGATLEEIFGENFGYKKEPVAEATLENILKRLDKLEGRK
jgi:transcriptional regulator with XRE-family HTH domain